MRHEIHDVDHLLDRAATEIRGARASETQVREAAGRVWQRLSEGAAQAAAGAAEVERIEGCDDYQALLPAYLAGSLPEARRLLVDDHVGSCVPCRKALKALRAGRVPAATQRRPETPPRPYARWALAAAAVLAGVAVVSLFLRDGLPFVSGPGATVQTAAEGVLYRITEGAYLPVAEGEVVAEGERVRTGRRGGAVLRLADGSSVELRERSEISIAEGRRGTTIDLERGSVIVEAAEQRERHLYVATDDCLVSVTGTIFSVNHGTKGSRVSVIEGEVRVDFSGEEAVLLPGEQVVTHASLGTVAVADDIAWSRDVDRYIGMLEELSALRRELDARVPRPGLRYASRLLDLMPEDTIFFGALPNLAETLTEGHRVLRERIDESPLLAEWWREHGGDDGFDATADELVEKIGRFGDYLGEELALGGALDADGELGGPVVMAEIVDAAGFRAFVEEEAAAHGGEPVFLEDPFAPAAGDDELYLWLGDGLVVASPRPERIRAVAEIVLEGADNPFRRTSFYEGISELYTEGVGLLAAADLERVVATSQVAGDGADAERSGEVLAHLGFDDVEHLMIEQKRVAEKTQHRAVLSFREARHGVASWLAAPAPMGSLDFLSPDTKFFAAFVFKDPAALVDDLESLLASAGAEMPGDLLELERKYGLSLRDDLAGSLGGELVLAVDGPLLPQPAFKMVLEVYDPARFQWTVEQAIAEVNLELAAEGREPIVLESRQSGGRTFHKLPGAVTDVCYTFVEGYLVAAPSQALLEQALRFRDSGYGIASSARFTATLPTDGHDNFSALVYHDVGEMLGPLAERIAQGAELSEAQRQALERLRAESKPVLAYAYGEEDRIVLATTSTMDLLGSGLLGLVGLGDPMGLGQLLSGLPEADSI